MSSPKGEISPKASGSAHRFMPVHVSKDALGRGQASISLRPSNRRTVGLNEIVEGFRGYDMPLMGIKRPNRLCMVEVQDGEAILQVLRVMARRYGALAHEGSMPDLCHSRGGIQQGEEQRIPLWQAAL
ncbi:MAG: hypothetical protein AB2805_07460 [Candidatus Thiodiazotropha sp.]